MVTNVPPTEAYTNYTFYEKDDETRELRASRRVNVDNPDRHWRRRA